MKSIGLSAYSFAVRDVQDIEYELHNIWGRSIIEIINNEALLGLNLYENNYDKESIFSYDQVVNITEVNDNQQQVYDALYLRVKTGEYGLEAEIVDSITGNLTHVKNQGEAEVMPFGCCIIVPSGAHTRGVIIFQSIGRYGIITVMKKNLEKYLQRVNDTLRLFIEPIMPRTCAAKLFEEGMLKSVRIVRYGIPDDDADRYGVDRGVKEIVEERVLRKPAGFLRNKATEIQKYFNRNCNMDEIVQIDGFEIDDLKFEFKNGKRTKTISLKNLDNVTLSEDITNDVTIENGHPTFDSLREAMKETGEYYLRARGALI